MHADCFESSIAEANELFTSIIQCSSRTHTAPTADVNLPGKPFIYQHLFCLASLGAPSSHAVPGYSEGAELVLDLMAFISQCMLLPSNESQMNIKISFPIISTINLAYETHNHDLAPALPHVLKISATVAQRNLISIQASQGKRYRIPGPASFTPLPSHSVGSHCISGPPRRL